MKNHPMSLHLSPLVFIVCGEFIAEPKEQGWGGRTAVMLDPDNNIIVLSGT
jgi:hypothetical protein